jgi:hypothetical protein
MDTAVAIRTLEATYKSSADADSVEAMIIKLTEREGTQLKSKGKAGAATRVAVLTWRSLLVMSREWKYYWLRLILYMILTLSIGTLYSGLGHSLSSVAVSLLNHSQHVTFEYQEMQLSFGVNISYRQELLRYLFLSRLLHCWGLLEYLHF